MIRIGKPIIENQGDLIFLKALVVNEAEKDQSWLWYATSKEFGHYFCPETADSFVVPMILRAVKTHQDVFVESELSERLFYYLNNSVFFAVGKAYEKRYGGNYQPKVIANKLRHVSFDGVHVGTGCSLGVDSFAVLKQYLFDNDVSESYKVTHLSLFNAGAFGGTKNCNNVEGVRESFFREVGRVQSFAEQIGLPLVWVDSNVRWFYPEGDFNWCHAYLNMGIVLSMQKLWKRYYYASGYSLENFRLDISDTAYYEPFLLPSLSTESTELISASMNMSRSDKVCYISLDEIVRKNLYVCLKEQNRNNPLVKNKYQGEYLNCGRCMKCERTILQLDILGRLEDFKGVFDLSSWPQRKRYYIGEVLAGRYKSTMLMDIYDSMIESKFVIPWFSRLYAIKLLAKEYCWQIRRKLSKIKRRVLRYKTK